MIVHVARDFMPRELADELAFDEKFGVTSRPDSWLGFDDPEDDEDD